MNKLNHVAFIMDGNGRWGKKKNNNRNSGHYAGVKTVKKIVEASIKLKIPTVTFYVFSTENWKRPKTEVRALMALLLKTIKIEIRELHKNNVRFTIIGDLEMFPNSTRKGLLEGISLTKDNDGLNLCLALNYGSRQEIIDGIKSMVKKIQFGLLSIDDISEKLFSTELYTKTMPDPDLLIRTSGECRLSNFLLWQSAYAEILMTDIYWPDFRENQLIHAIYDYQSRERRFGKLSDQIK